MSLEQWKNVDIFNPHVQWQNDLALRLVDTCQTIVERWGETGIGRFDYEWQDKFTLEDRDYYRDDVVVINIGNRYRKDYSTKIETWYKHITVFLEDTNKLETDKKVVLSAIKDKVRYGDPVSYGFTPSTNIIQKGGLSVFFIGSWLDHIESLRLKYEQNLKKQKEQQDKREEEYRRQNFGRID